MDKVSKVLTVLILVSATLSINASSISASDWESEGGSISPAKCSETKATIGDKEVTALLVTASHKEKFWGVVRKWIKDQKLSETPVLTLKMKASGETAKLKLPLPSIRVTNKKGKRIYAPKSAYASGSDGWTSFTWDISKVKNFDMDGSFRVEISYPYAKIPEGKEVQFYFIDIQLSPQAN